MTDHSAAKSHIVISGTGRSGTTFLMLLLCKLGLDTGVPDTAKCIFEHCRAGFESVVDDLSIWPHIVKSTWFCDSLDGLLEDGRIRVERAIVPIRDLYSAAQSRRHVTLHTDPSQAIQGHIPGGLFTNDPNEAEAIAARMLYNLMYTLAKHAVPTTLLMFPRLAEDPQYLYRELAPILNGISWEQFVEAFREVVRPEWVHDFKRPD